MVLFEVKIIIDEKWDNKGEKIHVLSVFCISQLWASIHASGIKIDRSASLYNVLGCFSSLSCGRCLPDFRPRSWTRLRTRYSWGTLDSGRGVDCEREGDGDDPP